MTKAPNYFLEISVDLLFYCLIFSQNKMVNAKSFSTTELSNGSITVAWPAAGLIFA
jgi:hypothetical protein